MKNENKWGDMVQLRMAAESVADAINVRTRIHNRIRSGSADAILLMKDGSILDIEGQPAEGQIAKSVMGSAVLDFEKIARDNLREQYEQAVPRKVQEWASSVPILKSGELFPRIVGLTGNPRWAVPLRMEGTGKDRKAVPDGDPFPRYCTCGKGGWDCRACPGLRNFWQWCGRGNPDLTVIKGDQASLLARGKITTVTPLLFTFSSLLVQGAGRSGNTRESALFKTYEEQKRRYRGHEGKCDTGTWPAKCARTHRRHYKTCRNHKVPPMSPDGCGTSAHPEWGEPGQPWRPGHINRHGLQIVEKEMLRQFWLAAEGTQWDE